MPTIGSKDIIDAIIAKDGYYEDDPRVLVVHSYDTVEGNEVYHIAYTPDEIHSLYNSAFVRNLKVLWTAADKEFGL